MKVLVTGATGSIGSHLSPWLLQREWKIIGLDNLNACYGVGLKNARPAWLRQSTNFAFATAGIENFSALARILPAAGPALRSATAPDGFINSAIAGINLRRHTEVPQRCLCARPIMDFQPLPTEDVPETDASGRTKKAVGYKPDARLKFCKTIR